MIVLDTHIWVWWVNGGLGLSVPQSETIEANKADTIGVSSISCWEIATAVKRNRIELPCLLGEWFERALNFPGVRLLELTPEIAIESTRLPGGFHRDPADQIIVATAQEENATILTKDERILSYQYVQSLW